MYACRAFLWACRKTEAKACLPFSSLHIRCNRWHSSWITRASLKCALPKYRVFKKSKVTNFWLKSTHPTVFFRSHHLDSVCPFELRQFARAETVEFPWWLRTFYQHFYAKPLRTRASAPYSCRIPVSLELETPNWKPQVYIDRFVGRQRASKLTKFNPNITAVSSTICRIWLYC